jgi:drug/metabolite transporter (DMT)-like permease
MNLFQSHFGEFAALICVICWTTTALAFESAGKKIGSLNVNLLRLIIGFICLTVFSWISRGHLFPDDASIHAWIWLSISGFVGFVIGDLFLFKAFVLIGARISMLLMASVPIFTSIIGWLLLGEVMTRQNLIGMALTIGGITMVILKREKHELDENGEAQKRKIKLSMPVTGFLFALLGAIGQAGGLVLSKFGMGDYNAFAATQIRVITGIAGFATLFFLLKRWGQIGMAFKNKTGLFHMSIGAFFGPFLGVAFSLLAVQNTKAGIASTIMAIVPVLIIVPSVFILKEKVNLKEIIGAIISVTGVAMFFL